MDATLLPPLPLSPLLPLLPQLSLSKRRHQHRFRCNCYRFLVAYCLPLRCLCFGHCCLPSRLPLLAADDIATVIAATNHCPLLLPPQPGDVQNITFKVIFWTSLLPLFGWLSSALTLPLLSPLLPAPAAARLSASSSLPRRAPPAPPAKLGKLGRLS